MMVCYVVAGNRLGFLSPTRLAGSEQVPSTAPPNCVREFDEIFDGGILQLLHLGKLLAYFFSEESAALHNSIFHQPEHLSPHYVFARLARAMLSLIAEFNAGLAWIQKQRSREGDVIDEQSLSSGDQDDGEADNDGNNLDEHDSTTDEGEKLAMEQN
ncbi:hypothetical protein BDV93DRAFT_610070 [Ceratobasidium sp. AG-I]|nr:hypothetical protein BDV93DRAFT_610070 [Ceratobasidium sp. AG-I]